MSSPFIMQIVGYKNAGKTTLISELVRRLVEQKVCIGTVKHDSHGFTADREGSDSWRHQEAGALYTAITSPYGTATFEKRGRTLGELIERMVRDTVISSDEPLDLILVEGFKSESYPKLVLLRDEGDVQLLEKLTNVAAVCLRFSPANSPNNDVGSRFFFDKNADTKAKSIDVTSRTFTVNNGSDGIVPLFFADEHEAIAEWLGRLVKKHRKGEALS